MFRSTNWSDSSTPPSFGGNFSPITEEKNELRSPVDDEQVNILPGPHESGRTRSCHVAVVFVHCRGAGSDRVHTNCWKTWFAMEGFVTKSARGAGFPAGTSPGETHTDCRAHRIDFRTPRLVVLGSFSSRGRRRFRRHLPGSGPLGADSFRG